MATTIGSLGIYPNFTKKLVLRPPSGHFLDTSDSRRRMLGHAPAEFLQAMSHSLPGSCYDSAAIDMTGKLQSSETSQR